MITNYPLSNQSDFEVMISSPLSHFDQKILTTLYMPIVGDKVISLYQTLYTLIAEGNFESDIFHHEKIIKLMRLRSIERFLDIRLKLEAIGLINVYFKDNFYIYHLKKPLDPEAFFNNIELSTILEYQIGHEEYQKYYLELMMRKLDINKFDNITTKFDDVYQIELSDTIYISQTSFNNINNGIVVTNQDFDFNQFMVLTAAHDVIDNKYFTDETFINLIKRYSFLYHLNPVDMKDVVILSCDVNKQIDYEMISKNAKKAFEQKKQKLGVVPKNYLASSSSLDNKLIRYLETASPSDFVKNKSGVALMSSEIEMFDRLLRDTNIGIGVLNVLIGQVLEFDNLKGEIPSYNYFLKVINTWKRAGVKTTSDAINYVSNKAKPKTRSNKNQKDVPDWYQDHLNQKYQEPTTIPSKNDDNLEDLKKFFKPNKKE